MCLLESGPEPFSPLFEGSAVFFHDDVVLAAVYAVVVECGDVGLQAEVLQTRDLGEDVVEHAAVVDRLLEGGHLHGHVGGVVDVRVAVVDGPVGAVGHLLPALVQRRVVQVDAQQFEQPLAGRVRLQVARLRQDRRHQVLVRLVVQVVVQDVQVVEDPVR